MDRRLLFTLVISCLGYTSALDCLGETCTINQYCQIQLHSQTAFCYTHHGHGHHEDHQKCIGAHHPGDHCFCLEQACVDAIARQCTTAPVMPATVPVVTAMLTTVPVVTAIPTTVPVVTAMPTTVTVKPTVHIEVIPCFGATCYTPSSCSVYFVNGVPVSGKCVPMVSTACGPLPTTGNCECDSKFCMSLMYTLTTLSTTPKSTVVSTMAVSHHTTTITMGQTTSVGTTPTITCTDNEDNLFNCQSYNDLYGMCTSSSSTLQNIAHTRCPKFCKICGSGIAPTKATLTGSVTLPTCVDHDQRCSQSSFQSILCKSTNPDTKKFAIATCPKSCNLCQEYIDSLLAPVTCNICGDLDGLIPCSNREITSNVTTTKCPSDKRFCMTDLYQDAKGNKDIFKRCVDENTCSTKWINESADQDYCMKYGTVLNPSQFQCHFCCTGDRCNSNILPPASTLVTKATGK